MAVNLDKPQRWKTDVAASVDMYNQWFLAFAPKAFRETRKAVTDEVTEALRSTAYGVNLSAQMLHSNPGVLRTYRAATAPPIAVARLSGLAEVPISLVQTLERGILPPRTVPEALDSNLEQIGIVLERLLDPDIFTWIEQRRLPTPDEEYRAATIVADRLSGSVANPLIRNAQEKRQLAAVEAWLHDRNYRTIGDDWAGDFRTMPSGTYTFHHNVKVSGGGAGTVNIPVDVVVMPHGSEKQKMPVLIECKSAGDFTNTNKRRKEEAQKMQQLTATYGPDVPYILFLGGYFDSGYLGYEAAEGIDWAWEHRIDDLAGFGL